jgi:hypothetical protein
LPLGGALPWAEPFSPSDSSNLATTRTRTPYFLQNTGVTQYFRKRTRNGVVMHIYNSKTQEAEGGGSQILSQPELLVRPRLKKEK